MSKPGFTKLTTTEYRNSLARKLIPCVDKIRDLHTQFGGRPYVLSFVKTRWTGNSRGAGIEEVVSEIAILPTPRVEDMSALGEILQPIGLDEVGSLQVSEISGRFFEDELLGLDKDGNLPGFNEQAYFEIQFMPTDGTPGIRRRFVPSSAPRYESYRFQWILGLTKVSDDRTRTGDPK